MRAENNLKILVVAAADEEMASFAALVETAGQSPIGGRKTFSCRVGDKAVVGVITGPGLVNAVQGLTAAMEAEAPDLVIQFGCAGAFLQADMDIGDLGLAAEEIDVHLGLEPARANGDTDADGSDHGLGLPDPLPFPVLKKRQTEFTNRYPLSKDLVQWACNLLKNHPQGKTRVVQGPFITVSTITASRFRADQLHDRFRPCMESMEGSGAAHVCLHYEVPFLEIRGASNIVGPRDRKNWNVSLAGQVSALAAKLIIENLTLEKLEFPV